MRVFPITWESRHDESPFCVAVHGKTPEGQAVELNIEFPVYFYVFEGKTPLELVVASLGADPTISCRVKRKNIWGYNPEKTYLQLGFRTSASARDARKRIRELYPRAKTFESSVDPVLRLCHVRNLSPTDWLEVSRYSRCPGSAVKAKYTAVSRWITKDIPPLVFASWDIECYSSTGGFPMAHTEDDCVIQIATTFWVYGTDEHHRTVVCLGETGPVGGVEVYSVESELELFRTWVNLLRDQRTDVLIGYNVWQFDWRYLADRLDVLAGDDGEPVSPFEDLGKVPGRGGVPKESRLASAAFGDNTFFILQAPGVLQLDVLQYIRREYKLESNSLKNVAKTFLQDQKIDLPPKDIFRLFEGTPRDRAVVAEYAVRDTELPIQLVRKLNIFQRLLQMGMATCVPVEYLLLRGQQIRVWSLLLRKAREMGYLVPDGEGIGATEKYAGATVLEAQTGAHFDIVSALDFASLYPSILRAKNMCYSTLLFDSTKQADVYTIGGTSFVQGVPAVIPGLLEDLAVFRKVAKTNMAHATDPFERDLFNAQQLAYKVSMNSVYGFLGASKGFLPCVPIAASVTATGA